MTTSLPIDTSKFYHNHIQNNIQTVEERKSSFLRLRKEFLQQFCQPLQQKIQKLDQQIEHYKHLVANQNQMIQTHPDVSLLKEQIAQFTQSQQFFLQHLQEYRVKTLQIQKHNQKLAEKISTKQVQISELARSTHEKVYHDLESERSIKDNRSLYSKKSFNKSGVSNNKSFLQSKIKSNIYQNSEKSKKYFLPCIFKVEKYYVKKELDTIQNKLEASKHKHQKSTKKNLQKVSQVDFGYMDSHNQDSSPVKYVFNQRAIKNQQEKVEEKKLKQALKMACKQYNQKESFLKQILELKKKQVQKSVTQLHSRLITHRQNFLKICEAISEKKMNIFTQEQFLQLSGDEVMTLFISFPWLQKSVFEEFSQMRKKIVDLQTKRIL